MLIFILKLNKIPEHMFVRLEQDDENIFYEGVAVSYSDMLVKYRSS